MAPLLVLTVCTMVSAERSPTSRMAAWHETLVRFDEVVPNTAVFTYNTDTVKSFFISKLVAYVDGESPAGATELMVDDFPGGVGAEYKLGGSEVKATLLPLLTGRETPAKDGASLYRIEASRGRKLTVECGPGSHVSNFAVAAFNGAIMRSLDFDYTTNNIDIEVEGDMAFMIDPQLPFVTAIQARGDISIEEDSSKGKFIRIESKGRKLDVVVAYGPDVESVRKLVPADPDKALKAVEDYYAELLGSRIETPEEKMDAAFRSAIYNLEYNYLAPYGWMECIGHWHSVWHQQHTRGAEWLGQVERSRQCIMEQAKLIFEDNQIPNIQPDGKGFRAFGGTNQYFMWEVRQYLKFTNDIKFARAIAPYLDRVLKGTFDRDDADGNMLFSWELQIGNQEDFVATPHDGATPTIEVINMMKTRAEVADVLGDKETARLWRSRAELALGNLRNKLWLKDLGRFAFFVDPQGVLRPDGQYHTFLYPAIWDIVDPIDQYTTVRHVRDRLTGEGGEVYGSNNFPEHYPGSWGMQAGCAQQPWGAWALNKVGLRSEAYRPLLAAAEWVMNENLRGSWPEVDGGHTPSYFTPPAGLYIAAMVESVFGLKPDLPGGVLEISPAFPDHWPEAKLELPEYKVDYRRDGNNIRYEVSGAAGIARLVRWKLPPCRIDTFKVNGGNADYRLEPGVGHVELIAKVPASQQTLVEFSFSELDYGINHPHSIAEGERFIMKSAGVKIGRVVDRGGVLSSFRVHESSVVEAQISEGLLDEYVEYGPLGALNFSRRSVFIECAGPGNIRFFHPVDLALLPRYEARFVDGKVLVRNNTQSRLAGNAKLFVMGAPQMFEVDVAARSEQAYSIELPAGVGKKLSPGENLARLVLPESESMDVPFLMEDAAPRNDAFEALALDRGLLMSDTDWQKLRVFQGQPHVFVAWGEWNQPLKSLEGKDTLAVPEIPGLEFAVNQRKFVPLSRKIGKLSYRQEFTSDEYKKFYLLLLPLVDNHDMFTAVARVNIHNGQKLVGGKVLTYPGDLDYINPIQAPVGGTYRGERERFPLLPLLGEDAGDWAEGKAPAFAQPEYWSRSQPVALDSGILTVVEIDLGEAREADSIVFEVLGEYAAFGVLGIVTEKAVDPSTRTVFDFKSAADLEGWALKGNAFSILSPAGGLFAETTLNSLAKAGEPATGSALSPEFSIREDEVALVLKWHGGKSEKVDGKESLSLRVIDAKSRKVLAEVPAPGSHVLSKEKISLKGMGDRSVRLELVDHDVRNAYAWIGLKSVRIKRGEL